MNEALKRILWQPISELDVSALPKNGTLAALDALRAEWERRWAELPESDRIKIRQRSLRKLAIETGIIERLYDIDWGLTLNLVAEGFTKDVIERLGGRIDDHTRLTLEAQRESLQMVLDFIGSGRELSVGFVRELHAAMTRTQATYVATDALGRTVDVRLEHGEWKRQPNHVERSDGYLLEYAPPEHVEAEMERLVSMYRLYEAQGVHPIAVAAWLHHRFVQIHPFADGNGRVARALVLLVLQKHRFAPLVVDRFHREKYIAALDAANSGDLEPLIKLFVNLESVSLTSELEAPTEQASGTSTKVAHVLADQIRALKTAKANQLVAALEPRAISVAAYTMDWLKRKSDELRQVFKSRNVQVGLFVEQHRFSDAEFGYWFKEQITRAAHAAGHYADFPPYGSWTQLRIRIDDLYVRFIASLHGAGQNAGVLAVVTFSELETRWKDEDGEPRKDISHLETTFDAFRVVHTESTEQINSRVQELSDLLDEGLSVTLAEIVKRQG